MHNEIIKTKYFGLTHQLIMKSLYTCSSDNLNCSHKNELIITG